MAKSFCQTYNFAYSFKPNVSMEGELTRSLSKKGYESSYNIMLVTSERQT